MKKFLPVFLLFAANNLFSQKVDSIYFHLYTDSLKKGVHNYINIDGKLSNGKWWPLSAKEISFTSSAGTFEGNDLIIPWKFAGESVEVTATLKSNTAISKKIIIWIKKKPDPEILPTKEEIMNKRPQQDSSKTKTKSKSKNKN